LSHPHERLIAGYEAMTPTSGALMRRAGECMPAGVTRTFGYFRPYPLVFERGEGSVLWDVDGNRYVDLVGNGLSLIHGHAYPPITRAIQDVCARGTAWPGGSRAQIEFAELLTNRIPGADRVRFTCTGTEANMLAVALARSVTGRPLILKARNGFHGSTEELLAGYNGREELPGRVILAEFGDVEDFERTLTERGEEIAAVILEPVLLSVLVTVPPEGFLARVADAARRAGALFILDDCLMLRLAVGGSAERYGLTADLTCLGKFIGGGLPVGAVLARSELMEPLMPIGVDGGTTGTIHHGGSFNGSVLGATSGNIAVSHLTADRISLMDAQATALAESLRRQAADAGLPLTVAREGSVMGLSVLEDDGATNSRTGTSDLHLAALQHGVYMAPGGLIAMTTSLTEADLDRASSGLGEAIFDVAEQRRSVGVR
jgi:glutamate-1-semialdehyde 2,1-aminomutase